MDNKRASVNVIEDFKGVFSDVESGDVPEGALWRQLNALSIRNGEIVSRGGLKEVTLDMLE